MTMRIRHTKNMIYKKKILKEYTPIRKEDTCMEQKRVNKDEASGLQEAGGLARD